MSSGPVDEKCRSRRPVRLRPAAELDDVVPAPGWPSPDELRSTDVPDRRAPEKPRRPEVVFAPGWPPTEI